MRIGNLLVVLISLVQSQINNIPLKNGNSSLSASATENNTKTSSTPSTVSNASTTSTNNSSATASSQQTKEKTNATSSSSQVLPTNVQLASNNTQVDNTKDPIPSQGKNTPAPRGSTGLPPTKKRSLIGYFQTQTQTPIEGRINVTNISPRVTHTIFAFATVDGDAAECRILDPYYDSEDTSSLPLVKLGNNGNSSCTADKRGNGNLAALYALKKENPHMRVLLSVGGASDEKAKNFSMATDSSDRVANLAKSCVKLAFSYGLDGIDYDWESPNSTLEWSNYNELLTQTRSQMNTYEFKERYLMTVALMPMIFFSNQSQTAIPKIAQQVDFVNLMTYDAAPGSDRALHNAPLYSTAESYGAMSINDTVVQALNFFSPSKIMIGQPLYGISMTTTPNTRTSDLDSNRGLFEQVVQSPPGGATAGAVVGGSRPVMYNTIRDSYLNNANFTRYWDDSAKATWLYNSFSNQFITYSDESSIQAVLDYVEQYDLGGVFFWQLGGSFNRKTSREELVEFTAGHISVDYTKRAVCAPQASFCNLRSDCPANMRADGTLPEGSSAISLSCSPLIIFTLLLIIILI